MAKLLGGRPTGRSGLRELLLRGGIRSDAGADAIASHLSQPWCAMKRLVMRNCIVGDEGAKLLGEALTVNTTLKVLELSMGRIESEGGHAIGVGLQSNSTLQELSISYNPEALSGSSPQAFGKALGKNASIALRRFEAYGATVNGAGLHSLATGLASNTTLRDLVIDAADGDCTDGARLLLDAAASHPTLQMMSMSGVEATDSVVASFAKLLQQSASAWYLILGMRPGQGSLPATSARSLSAALAATTTCR